MASWAPGHESLHHSAVRSSAHVPVLHSIQYQHLCSVTLPSAAYLSCPGRWTGNILLTALNSQICRDLAQAPGHESTWSFVERILCLFWTPCLTVLATIAPELQDQRPPVLHWGLVCTRC